MLTSPINLRLNFITPFTFSQSSIQDYVDCPRRFQLRYIDKMDWPAIESEPVLDNEKRLQEGKIFHRLVHQQLLGLSENNLQTLANTPNLERWWKNWIEFRSTVQFGEVMPEFTLTCPIGGHRLLAKYDLLTIKAGNAIIYDWKTYARRPRNEWLSARWQTRVYPAMLLMAGAHLNGGKPFDPERVELVYWFSDYPLEPAKFSYSAGLFKRDNSAIEQVIDGIASALDFPLTEDRKKCSFCVYRSYCDRGRQAAIGQNDEDGAESVVNSNVQFEQMQETEF